MAEAGQVAGRLAGKVAVVTGGASGIGRAIAMLFSREGAQVVVADLPGSRGEEVAGELAAVDGQALFVPLDVSQPGQVQALAEAAVAAYGGIDVLVNAAGILAFGTVVETDPETWNRVIAVNLTGTFLCCRAMVPIIISRGGGSVINFSSSTGNHDAGSAIAAYVASKGGVALLTKAMAVDHSRDRVRVNAICPGPVDTPMLRSVMNEEQIAAFGRSLPIGRMGLPEEIAAAALFLASDEASFASGGMFPIDGGQTALVGPTPRDL